jgi:hypothetical protein
MVKARLWVCQAESEDEEQYQGQQHTDKDLATPRQHLLSFSTEKCCFRLPWQSLTFPYLFLEALDLVLVDFLLRDVALRRERGFRFAFFLVPGLVPGDEILLIFASELGDPSSDWVSLISSSNHDWMSPSSSSALLT